MSHREKDSTESRKFDKLLFSIYLLGWETLVILLLQKESRVVGNLSILK